MLHMPSTDCPNLCNIPPLLTGLLSNACFGTLSELSTGASSFLPAHPQHYMPFPMLTGLVTGTLTSPQPGSSFISVPPLSLGAPKSKELWLVPPRKLSTEHSPTQHLKFSGSYLYSKSSATGSTNLPYIVIIWVPPFSPPILYSTPE